MWWCDKAELPLPPQIIEYVTSNIQESIIQQCDALDHSHTVQLHLSK